MSLVEEGHIRKDIRFIEKKLKEIRSTENVRINNRDGLEEKIKNQLVKNQLNLKTINNKFNQQIFDYGLVLPQIREDIYESVSIEYQMLQL